MNKNIVFSKSEKNGLKLIKKNDLNILSVGISTGGQTEIEMIKMNGKRKVIATTIDKKGLEFTKKQLEEEGLSNNNIEVKYQDVTKKTHYRDESFDFIYARLVLHYLNDNQLIKALNELYRLLKVNGKLFIVVRSNNDIGNNLEDSTYNPLTGMTKHPDFRTIGTDNVVYIERRFHSKDSLTKALEKANFKVLYIKEYKEQLYSDYERKEKALKIATLLEITAIKK